MILYLIRFAWIAAQVLVLIAGQSLKVRYRCFAAYMLLSTMLSAAYWPELLPGWDEAFAGWMVAALCLRTLACLEALHVQTRGFPQWPRMMAGAFLSGFLVVVMLAGVRDNQWAGLVVEYRRYLQIWVMVVMAATLWLLYDRQWWNRFDRHALIMFGLACNHGLVSWWCMAKHPGDGAWLNLNSASCAVDAALYLVWAWIIPADVEKSERASPQRSRPLRVVAS